MIPRDEFPHLTNSNHRVTSPESRNYNCIAWAVGDIANWWQPGVFWPIPTDPEETDLATLNAHSPHSRRRRPKKRGPERFALDQAAEELAVIQIFLPGAIAKTPKGMNLVLFR